MLARAIVRLSQATYPRSFRLVHGEELAEVVLQRWSAERREFGLAAGLRYAGGTLFDLVRTGLRMRFSGSPAPRPDRSEPKPPRSPKAGFMDQTLQDVRLAVRMLVSRPLFTSIAVLSLALGIGANSAVFSLVDAVLIRSMPVEAPHELVVPLEQRDEGRYNHNWAYPDFVDYQARARLLDLAGYSFATVSFAVDGAAERAQGLQVSGNYFDLLGVDAVAGRTFIAEEYATLGTHPVVVVSHGYWQSRFAADRDIAGRKVTINGHPFTVIGVSAEGFTGTRPGLTPQFFVPLMMYYETIPPTFVRFLDLEERRSSWLYLVGRLRPGVEPGQARDELEAIMASLEQEYPESNQGRRGMVLMPGARGHYGVLSNLTTPLLAVMVVVGLLLLIACANVANLLLARAAARNREIGVRLAMGASRGMLIRQLLTESVLLATVAGFVGVGVAMYGLAFLITYLQGVSNRALQIEVGVDPTVLAFTAGLSLITGVIFGLVPALRASRSDVVGALKDDGTSGSLRSRGRVFGLTAQNGLVVVQVALSFGLLVGAGLLVRSVVGLAAIDPGSEPEGALVMQTDASLAGYDDDQARLLYAVIKERLEAVPGVEVVGFGRAVPVDRSGTRGSIVVEGRDERTPEIDQNNVDVGYFQAVGISIVRGRAFNAADTVTSGPVAIVNRTFADTYWPGENPLGKHLAINAGNMPAAEVVGIAVDGKYRGLRGETQPYVYLPLRQLFRSNISIVVRTTVEPESMFAAVRNAIDEIDSNLPVYALKTLQDKVDEAYFETRVTAWLLGLFSVLGMALAAFGLYGVLAFSIARRTREIGVRMALGAKASNVVGLVLRQGLVLVIGGIALGIALAAAVTRFLGTLLYGIEPMDPITIAGTALFLGSIAVVACYLPAARATKVDPVLALRQD